MLLPSRLTGSTNPAGRLLAHRAYGEGRRGFNARIVLLLAALLPVALLFVAPLAVAADKARILAFGDSLTAGYGLARQESFPARLEAALDDAGVGAEVSNAGVSGDTTSAALQRLDWLLQGHWDLVIVEIGANDGLRGIDPALTRANLDRIVGRAMLSGARVLLAGMKAPPNLGREYGAAFNDIFPAIARKYDVAFYPFFLDGVAAEPALNQQDGMHPNAKGVAIIVERMLPFVVKALGKEAPR